MRVRAPVPGSSLPSSPLSGNCDSGTCDWKQVHLGTRGLSLCHLCGLITKPSPQVKPRHVCTGPVPWPAVLSQPLSLLVQLPVPPGFVMGCRALPHDEPCRLAMATCFSLPPGLALTAAVLSRDIPVGQSYFVI